MQKTLTSRSDKVNQNPAARNVGQSNATVQAASNPTSSSINLSEVAESLRGKGIPSQKIDSLAAAIVARVNGQQLTKTQQSILSFELGTPSVQNIISELIKKKAEGIDSAQNRLYDGGNISLLCKVALDQAHSVARYDALGEVKSGKLLRIIDDLLQ